MTPYYSDDTVTLHAGDCRDILTTLPDASVDAVATDPPYELGFMGKAWDAAGVAYDVNLWHECLRVLKPGGHMLAFGGTRTWHRLACAVEDAGFEIRDTIAWLYGSGFPKSLDVGKAIDRAAGAERAVRATNIGYGAELDAEGERVVTAPATDEARRWHGWGTALKPAHEPIVVARKPLTGIVAANVVAHGTGALNIDACRVATDEDTARTPSVVGDTSAPFGRGEAMGGNGSPLGRWPANVVLDGAAADELDQQSGTSTSPIGPVRQGGHHRHDVGMSGDTRAGFGVGYGDEGGASRFFPVFRYEPKAPTDERPRDGAVAHPTVKPLDLMRWLVRLVTPPGGLVLDPFAGSGTTGEACVVEGFRCLLIEREPTYLPLIVARLTKPIQPALFGEAS